ncbi:MAG: HD-GYP domain-containing protein, partial [Gammaproteobacteria bacterium]|nr:HD-GYP domain-containing protein [Gammaproteobacteria bacterium]
AWLAYLRKGDNYTYNHSIASSVWAILLGRHLGFDRETLDKIAMGGMLMDVGKLKVPKELLSKPGPLTEEEFTIVQQHVDHSVEIVKQSPGIDPAIMEMIEYHHERYDGSGYPHSVGGSEIPIFGRIGGIVDCFDAMITQRTYANARSSYDAIRELNKLAGTHFQCELVEQFVQALGMFPTGSLVELNSGHVGIVTEQNSVHRLRPRLMLVLGPDKQPLRKCKGLDLRQCSSKEDQPNARWIACGHEAGAFGINVNDYFF